MFLASWLRSRHQSSAGHRGRARVKPATFRPRLESLDDRALPSTFYAATPANLIADINASNRAGGANTIVLTAPTTSPYVFTAAFSTVDGADVLPVINAGPKKADNLTIVGNGDTLDASRLGRLFAVEPGNSLTLQNMTLQHGLSSGVGNTQGGAIRSEGALVLSHVTVQFNEALGVAARSKNGSQSPGGDALGGGIMSFGSLTIDSSVIQNNLVIGAGSDSGYGGGICTAGGAGRGPATISNSFIGGNRALGGYNATTGTYANTTGIGGYGGGVAILTDGTATFTNDSIQNNSAGSGIDAAGVGFNNWGVGGGIYITGATVSLDTFTVNNTYSNISIAPGATTDIWGNYTLIP